MVNTVKHVQLKSFRFPELLEENRARTKETYFCCPQVDKEVIAGRIAVSLPYFR